MSKIILFDIDGVVIGPREKYFSNIYSEEYGVPLEDVLMFFKNEYKQCAKGKLNVKTALKPYLQKWGWEDTVDSFLNYWLESDSKLNPVVLELVESLRAKGTRCYLASDNEEQRARYILNNLELGEKFDGSFFSCRLGFEKTEPEFFEKVMSELGVEAANIIFIDDDPENTEVAEKLGITTIVFEDFEELRNNLVEHGFNLGNGEIANK